MSPTSRDLPGQRASWPPPGGVPQATGASSRFRCGCRAHLPLLQRHGGSRNIRASDPPATPPETWQAEDPVASTSQASRRASSPRPRSQSPTKLLPQTRMGELDGAAESPGRPEGEGHLGPQPWGPEDGGSSGQTRALSPARGPVLEATAGGWSGIDVTETQGPKSQRRPPKQTSRSFPQVPELQVQDTWVA